MARQKTTWGTDVGTAAESMEIVIRTYQLGQIFTEDQIDLEIRRRGLPNRDAKYQHLNTLQKRGYVQKVTTVRRGWLRVR